MMIVKKGLKPVPVSLSQLLIDSDPFRVLVVNQSLSLPEVPLRKILGLYRMKVLDQIRAAQPQLVVEFPAVKEQKSGYNREHVYVQ